MQNVHCNWNIVIINYISPPTPYITPSLSLLPRFPPLPPSLSLSLKYWSGDTSMSLYKLNWSELTAIGFYPPLVPNATYRTFLCLPFTCLPPLCCAHARVHFYCPWTNRPPCRIQIAPRPTLASFNAPTGSASPCRCTATSGTIVATSLTKHIAVGVAEEDKWKMVAVIYHINYCF